MVDLTLHSYLGKQFGENWELDVCSVAEALHALNILTKEKLYHSFLENDKKGIKYEILINKKKFKSSKPLDKLTEENIKEIRNSELTIKNNNIKTIDIVPVIEGAQDVLAIVLGSLLIVVGILTSGFGGGVLIVAGIGLIAAGVINLLSSPPKFEDFTEGKIRNSYLFAGPQNTTKEGAPVPVNYGRLIGGSHVISASYEITNIDADINQGGSSGR